MAIRVRVDLDVLDTASLGGMLSLIRQERRSGMVIEFEASNLERLEEIKAQLCERRVRILNCTIEQL